MRWTFEAETAIKKVPFFVRKRVRQKVEKEAIASGKNVITPTEIQATKARFLSNMETQVKGYQLDTCFGPDGCPHRANPNDGLLEQIEAILIAADLSTFLKQHVQGPLRLHHEFRVTTADCPNACSQPQIKDIGIIGAVIPLISGEDCNLCGECIKICREKALQIDDRRLTINYNTCLFCGECIKVCSTGTLKSHAKGYRIMLAGKLGRHPRMAMELPGIYNNDNLISVIRNCLKIYKSNSKYGQRFATIFKKNQLSEITADYSRAEIT